MWSPVPALRPDLSHDAVVVVPGIMGSALYDTEVARPVWGLSVRLLREAWQKPDGLLPLHLTPDERNGRLGRIKATGLLEFPAWAPMLKGFEPYADLVRAVREVTAHELAVLAFAYDWRLSVAHNGALLAEAARRHLTAWRAHPAHDAARRLHPEERPARLVFVAHSMGGLVTRAALAHSPDLGPDTRAVATLGTPFYGAVKAAAMLNGGRHGPGDDSLKGRLQALASTLPGVHDLLPDFRCVDAGLDVHRLTPDDVGGLGGDRELAAQAQEFQQRMRAGGQALPGHHAVVGMAQATSQSLRVEAGLVHEQSFAFRTHADGQLIRDRAGVPVRHDRTGDGTVYLDSARLPGPAVTYLPLQHGALAKDGDCIRHVRTVITSQDEALGPPLGGGELGLDIPDSVPAGKEWWVRLTGVDTYAGVSCSVHEAGSGRRVALPRLGRRDGVISARVLLPEPGLYRVRADTGGRSPVTQLVMMTAPDGRA